MDIKYLAKQLSRWFWMKSDVIPAESVSVTPPTAETIGDLIAANQRAIADADYIPFSATSNNADLASISLTNFKKNINTPRIYTTTSIAGTPGTLTLDYTTYDYYEITAQAAALDFANPTVTSYVGGEKFVVSVTCDGTARALTYGNKFEAKGGLALPSTLIASKRTTFGFVYHAASTKFNLVGLAQEV